VSREELVRAVRAERRRTLELLRRVEPGQFDALTALPGWRVREVVAHLITVDRAAVTGGILAVAFGPADRLEAWNERRVRAWAGRPVPDLLVALDRWGRRFAALVAALPRAVYRLPVPTQWGVAPAGTLVRARAYDEWVHRQDIRRALGMGDEEVDLATAAEFLLEAIARSAVRRAEAPGGTVVVSLEGAPVHQWRFDLSARTGGPDGTGPADARVAGPAPTFIMAAAGREAFDDLIGRGVLAVEGDDRLARAFLAAVRVV
jgi:uncharacterized protein (TIGR03083 family)